MGLIGWNTLKNKRHWELRWGQCAQCHEPAYRSSYDATRTFCVIGIPVLPLSRVHVHEDCQACQTSEVVSAREWESRREQHLYPAQQTWASHPQDPNAASALLEHLSLYGDHTEFAKFAADIRKRHKDNPTILSQLAWCYGRFGDFESARNLLADALALVEDSGVRRQAETYATLPNSDEPKRPSRLGQWLTMMILPLLIMFGVAAWLTFGWKDDISHVYVVNGLGEPYTVHVNDTKLTLAAHGRQRLFLDSGAVEVRSSGTEGFTFDPYQFAVKPGGDEEEPTVIINPDKAAVISWEELVYQHADGETPDGLADQFAFHTGDAYYVFRGITDHFVDPPDTVEVHSNSEATYRYLVKLVDLDTPFEIASILLSYGEVELASVYARNLLTHDPTDYDVLEILANIAPNGETMEFMKPYLEKSPLSLPWHLAYQAIEAQLMPEVDQEAYYQSRLQAEPDNKAILHLLGLVTDSPQMAVQYWQRAAQPPDRVLQSLQSLALRAANQALFDEALEFLRQAREELPDNTVFQEMVESYMIAQGRFDELIPQYVARVRADALDQDAAMTLAGLYEVSGSHSEAEGIVENFIRAALESDPSLDAESLEGLRLIFRGVMARWANDPDKFIEITDQLGQGDWTMSALFLKGELEIAVDMIGQTKDDPFIFLTLYALTMTNNEPEKSEEHLGVALKAFEADSHWRQLIVPWFQADAPPPSLNDTLKVSLDNADRRVLLTALGLRHPELHDACFELARKLNHDRSFPYLTLQCILE